MAYRATYNQTVTSYLDRLDALSLDQRGRKLTREERVAAAGDSRVRELVGSAAAFEAWPEAIVDSALDLFLFTKLGYTLPAKLNRAVQGMSKAKRMAALVGLGAGRLALSVPPELVSEGITAVGQSRAEFELGTRLLPPLETLREGMREIGPQVIVTTLAMGGAGATSRGTLQLLRGTVDEATRTVNKTKLDQATGVFDDRFVVSEAGRAEKAKAVVDILLSEDARSPLARAAEHVLGWVKQEQARGDLARGAWAIRRNSMAELLAQEAGIEDPLAFRQELRELSAPDRIKRADGLLRAVQGLKVVKSQADVDAFWRYVESERAAGRETIDMSRWTFAGQPQTPIEALPQKLVIGRRVRNGKLVGGQTITVMERNPSIDLSAFEKVSGTGGRDALARLVTVVVDRETGKLEKLTSWARASTQWIADISDLRDPGKRRRLQDALFEDPDEALQVLAVMDAAVAVNPQQRFVLLPRVVARTEEEIAGYRRYSRA